MAFSVGQLASCDIGRHGTVTAGWINNKGFTNTSHVNTVEGRRKEEDLVVTQEDIHLLTSVTTITAVAAAFTTYNGGRTAASRGNGPVIGVLIHHGIASRPVRSARCAGSLRTTYSYAVG